MTKLGMECPKYSKCLAKKIREKPENYFFTNPALEFNIQISRIPLYLSFALVCLAFLGKFLSVHISVYHTENLRF